MPYREDLAAAHELIEQQQQTIEALKADDSRAWECHAEVLAQLEEARNQRDFERLRRGFTRAMWVAMWLGIAMSALAVLIMPVHLWAVTTPPEPEPRARVIERDCDCEAMADRMRAFDDVLTQTIDMVSQLRQSEQRACETRTP